MIDVGRPKHLLDDEVRRVVDDAAVGRLPIITDAAAVTIASWFASPLYNGLVFAALATTGRCERRQLETAIDTEMGWVARSEVDPQLALELTAFLRELKRWCAARDDRPTVAGEEGGTDEERR